MQAAREIELQGHIIDSMILPKIFDKIYDMNGEFEVLEFRIGKLKTEPSYARILVTGKDDEHLDDILSELHRLGARLPEVEDVKVEPAPANRVVPRGFYSTTNHPTYVKYRGEWKAVESIKMDSIIAIEGDRAVCKTLAHIRKDDLIVVGKQGIRVLPPERPRGRSVFEFMGGGVSPERPSQSLISQIADEMQEIKKSGGKIGVVGGPAIVHTGASPALAEIIRKGYVDVLLAGNALAVHDIERNLYGTSLGMDLKIAEPRPEGHKNHLYAISEIIKVGSIKKAVKRSIVTDGIMYECVKNDVPFILAGSIRDDGPLPDVITDTMKAQDKIRDAIKNVDLMLMLATMLHSIAVGNHLASTVKTVCVDINPAVVTKLLDRGSAQAIGIVTDVGTFLPMLNAELEDLRAIRNKNKNKNKNTSA